MATTRRNFTIVLALISILVLAACEREVTVTETVYASSSCFECHSDNNTALVSAEAQYDHSKHASGENIDRNSSTCSPCHTSEGFVAKVTGGPRGTVLNPTAIHCFTCHRPHTTGSLALRVTAPPPLQNGAAFNLNSANICVECHQSRRNVNTYVAGDSIVELDDHWGPHHGPQGDMVIGSNGYEFENYSYRVSSGHNSATRDGCLDCHFEATSNYVVGGHSFNMEYEEGAEEILNVGSWDDDVDSLRTGCRRCHGEDVDDFSIAGVQDSVTTLTEALKGILVSASIINDENEPIDGTVVSADSAGALWNYLMVIEDRSKGIHNPKYVIDLLYSSIQFMTGPPPPAVAGRR